MATVTYGKGENTARHAGAVRPPVIGPGCTRLGPGDQRGAAGGHQDAAASPPQHALCLFLSILYIALAMARSFPHKACRLPVSPPLGANSLLLPNE